MKIKDVIKKLEELKEEDYKIYIEIEPIVDCIEQLDGTKEDFRLLLQDKFNKKLSIDALRRYLNKHHIEGKYIDYKKSNVRDRGKCPIGAEQITKDGVFIKVAQPDKWRRKSRVMYEKYHNCKLEDDEYIIFLNHDNNDFSIDNLIKSNKKRNGIFT